MKNAVLALLVCALPSIAAAQLTAVRAGRLVDPDSGTVLTDQVVVVAGGEIQAVGKGFAVPAGGKGIGLFRKTGVPGFIDCPTHLAEGPGVGDGGPFHGVEQTA